MTCASSAACTPRPSTTSRPSPTCRPATRSPAGPASGAWASYGLGSLNQNLPTFVVLVAKPTNTEQVQAISARLWSVGLPVRRARRRLVPHRRRPDPVHQQPARRARRGPPHDARRPARQLNEMNYQAGRRPGDAHAHPAVRDGVPHAGQRAGADRPRPASRSRTFKLYGDDGQEAGHVRQHRAAGPAAWSSAACASCRSTTTTGTRTATSPAGCPTSAATSIRPCYGLIQDLKQRGLFDDDAGHLGRRVRPDDLLAGRPDARRTTAATTTRAASRCGWPAAARRPGTIYGETDDFSLQHRQGPGPHPRLPRHGAAPARLRPRALHATATRGSTSS